MPIYEYDCTVCSTSLVGFAMWKILTFLQVVQIVEADLNGSYLYLYITDRFLTNLAEVLKEQVVVVVVWGDAPAHQGLSRLYLAGNRLPRRFSDIVDLCNTE